MAAIFMGLTSALAGLYGAFEFWTDYKSLRQTVVSYKAPDLSGFDKRIDVMRAETVTLREDMESLRTRVLEVQDITRDTKSDVRDDATQIYSQLSAVDKRSRSTDVATRNALRVAEQNIRSIIDLASARFEGKIGAVDTKLDKLETNLDKKLQQALDNPLLK